MSLLILNNLKFDDHLTNNVNNDNASPSNCCIKKKNKVTLRFDNIDNCKPKTNNDKKPFRMNDKFDNSTIRGLEVKNVYQIITMKVKIVTN